MSVDLSAAVEAALHAVHKDCGCDDSGVRDDARHAVTAAAPLIEQAVREAIAAELDALADGPDAQRDTDTSGGLWQGYHDAARIARGTP